jgi:DNA-directed RNA polymerase specialized sigma24 family protein
MNHIYSKHKHWIKIVNKFGESQYAEDVVQEAYIKLHGKDINEAYFYYTLRSLTMTLHKKKVNKIEITQDIEYSLVEEDDEFIIDLAKPYQDYIETWEWYDKKLFLLWVESGVSMREIARRTNIGFMSVYNTIKNCKIKIKQWEKENHKD